MPLGNLQGSIDFSNLFGSSSQALMLLSSDFYFLLVTYPLVILQYVTTVTCLDLNHQLLGPPAKVYLKVFQMKL